MYGIWVVDVLGGEIFPSQFFRFSLIFFFFLPKFLAFIIRLFPVAVRGKKFLSGEEDTLELAVSRRTDCL